MWSLSKDSAGLDVNSPYAYLLFSEYFPDTCILAECEDEECEDEPVGFVLGFRSPQQPETLFVWQITVAPTHRGQGIGVEMLGALLERLASDGVTHLEATVTPSNTASRKMFQALARRFDAPYIESPTPLFPRELFPDGAHEDERAVRIGPLRARAREPVQAARTASAE